MKRGFTLIELMIVIAILGTIMTTGLYPGFSVLKDAERRDRFCDYLENMMNLVTIAESDLQAGNKTMITENRLVIVESGNAVEYISMPATDKMPVPEICRIKESEKTCFAGLSFQAKAFSDRYFRIDYALHSGGERNFVLTEVHSYVQ